MPYSHAPEEALSVTFQFAKENLRHGEVCSVSRSSPSVPHVFPIRGAHLLEFVLDKIHVFWIHEGQMLESGLGKNDVIVILDLRSFFSLVYTFQFASTDWIYFGNDTCR